jgi:fructosamine-3-kinase
LLDLGAPEALPYLAARFRTDPALLQVTPLGGGVSNIVVLAEAPHVRAVLKQALEKLRVEQDWFCSRDRIFNEVTGLRALASLLPAAAVPAVLFEDREQCLFAMEAAPRDAPNLKDLLLAGRAPAGVGATLGSYLGQWVAATYQRPEWRETFGSLEIFDNLRLDPYYRATALRHPDLAPHFESLIEECSARRVALVHGDYSPKNVLLWDGRPTLIDLEVAHFGDPSFDAAFFTNHLVLKSFYRPSSRAAFAAMAAEFWTALRAALPAGLDWFEPATIRHLGCLMLARVDGKSPAEYLRDPELRGRVRDHARRLILRPPATIAAHARRLILRPPATIAAVLEGLPE